MEFGQYLRTLRKEKNIGVRELARRAGISQGYMSQIETSKRNVKPEMLRKISKALDVSYLMLLKEIGYVVDEDLKNTVKTEKIMTVDLKVSEFYQVIDNEKVFKELVERLSQSAYYYGLHRNEEWQKAFVNDKQTLIKFFKNQNK